MKHFRDIKIAIASLAIGISVGLVGLSFAGTGSVSDAVPGTTIFASDFNKITGALKVDLVPRNSSGVAAAEAGNLGTSTYPWGAIFFGDPASQIQISDAGNEINFRVGGNIEARIGTTGLSLDSLADGLITYAKLNADAIFKLKKFNATQAVPAGVTEIIVVGCGGGGGGGAGGAGDTYGGGGGGGAGAPISIATVTVTALSTVTITNASGGTAGAGGAGSGGAGGTGGTTTVAGSFGTLRFTGANGGTGGTGTGACANCAGGAGATSTLRNGLGTIAGGRGADGQSLTGGADGDFSMYNIGGAFNPFYGSATTGGGGGGGGSSFGAGALGGRAGAVGLAPPTAGSTGGLCAGGGGGGGAAGAGNGANGGAGGPGQATVYFVAP